jgi:hypothetical protein
MSQEERSVFWEVIVSIIISKKYIRTCPILNGFQDRAISLYRNIQDALRRATCHVLTQVANCVDVDGGVF